MHTVQQTEASVLIVKCLFIPRYTQCTHESIEWKTARQHFLNKTPKHITTVTSQAISFSQCV